MLKRVGCEREWGRKEICKSNEKESETFSTQNTQKQHQLLNNEKQKKKHLRCGNDWTSSH